MPWLLYELHYPLLFPHKAKCISNCKVLPFYYSSCLRFCNSSLPKPEVSRSNIFSISSIDVTVLFFCLHFFDSFFLLPFFPFLHALTTQESKDQDIICQAREH
eukprot:c28303_g3_i1 orf=685-993(+)